MHRNKNDRKESEDMKLKICNPIYIFNTSSGFEKRQEREQKEASCKTIIPDGRIRRAQ